MATIKNIIDILDQWAPAAYAEDFDNVGLLIGEAKNECSGILVSLDCIEKVVDEAIESKCNMIICFHPIVFSGLKKALRMALSSLFFCGESIPAP